MMIKKEYIPTVASVHQLIQKKGNDALEYSMCQLAQMVDRGDQEGAIAWGQIQRGLIEIQKRESPKRKSLKQRMTEGFEVMVSP